MATTNYQPPGRVTTYNVPDDPDVPDIPQDFRDFAASQWNYIGGGVRAQLVQMDTVSQGQGSLPVIDANHSFPAGTLMYISGSFFGGVFGNAVISYFDLRQNNVIISPQYIITGAPPGMTFAVQTLLISTGPSYISCNVQTDTSTIAVNYRYLNIQGLQRG